jgi:hypothetical protein
MYYKKIVTDEVWPFASGFDSHLSTSASVFIYTH